MTLARLFAVVACAGAVLSTTRAAADPGLEALCGECRPVRVATCGSFLEGPNFDREGRLWAVDYRGGNIVRIADGKCANVANTGGMANGSRFHRDGRLFIADAKKGLLIFDPRTNRITERATTIAGRQIEGANDLVFDAAGGLYMTARMTASKYDPNGMVLYLAPGETSQFEVLADKLPFPNGIAISVDGSRLFVGLYAEKEIIVLAPRDRPPPYLTSWTFLRTEGGVGPDGMTVDAQDRLLYANFGDAGITVADSAGRKLGRIALPEGAGTGTTNVVVHEGALYITEAFKGEVWRVPLKP